MARLVALGTLIVVAGTLFAYLVYLWLVGTPPFPADAFTATFVILGSGLTATALIEMAKRLSQVRGRAHRRFLTAWVQERLRVVYQVLEEPTADADPDGKRWPWLMRETLDRLSAEGVVAEICDTLRVGVYGAVEALDLPAEQIAARLARAMDSVVRAPRDSLPLYLVFIGLDEYVRLASSDKPPREDRSIGSRGDHGDWTGAPMHRPLQSTEVWTWAHEPTSLGSALEAASARAGAAVDDLHATMAKRWVALLTWASIMISALIGAVLSLFTLHTLSPALVLLAMTVGALVSWTTRDIGAAIARLRTRV